MSRTTIDISILSTDQRLALIEEFWDSVAAVRGEPALTDAQRDELDRRLDEMERDDTLGVPWAEALRQIRGRTKPAESGVVTRPVASAEIEGEDR